MGGEPVDRGGATLIEQGRERYSALKHPGITHAVLVPAFLANVLAAPADAFPRNDAMHLFVGGGAMSRLQVEQTKARVSSHLFNWLASTEAGGIALTRLDTPEDLRWQRLIPDKVVEIVDEADRLLPANEIGRIRVATAGGPTSYLHDEATTQAFFKDGYFYPGDLALMRSDGRIALQGRSTDVINLRGIKVSAAPVEDKLCETFGATGVCVFSMQNEYGEEDIHVVVERQSPVEYEPLIAQLRQALGNFRNAHVYLVTALPRNEMGKVLRQAVRARVLAKKPPLSQ